MNLEIVFAQLYPGELVNAQYHLVDIGLHQVGWSRFRKLQNFRDDPFDLLDFFLNVEHVDLMLFANIQIPQQDLRVEIDGGHWISNLVCYPGGKGSQRCHFVGLHQLPFHFYLIGHVDAVVDDQG